MHRLSSGIKSLLVYQTIGLIAGNVLLFGLSRLSSHSGIGLAVYSLFTGLYVLATLVLGIQVVRAEKTIETLARF